MRRLLIRLRFKIEGDLKESYSRGTLQGTGI